MSLFLFGDVGVISTLEVCAGKEGLLDNAFPGLRHVENTNDKLILLDPKGELEVAMMALPLHCLEAIAYFVTCLIRWGMVANGSQPTTRSSGFASYSASSCQQ